MKIRICHLDQELCHLDLDLSNEDDLEEANEEPKKIVLSQEAVVALIGLLTTNQHFQRMFVHHHENPQQVDLVFNDPILALIDYKSCDITFQSVWLQVELEDALHWLSTLGGAYSNLGDHSLEFVSLLTSHSHAHVIFTYMHFNFFPGCQSWFQRHETNESCFEKSRSFCSL